MASYRVLPAVSSGGGDFGLAIGQGVNAYQNAMMRRSEKEEKEAKEKKEKAEKEKKAEENKSAYAQAAQDSGMELSGLTYDDQGVGKYSYKKKEDPTDDILKDPGKTIQRAMMGIGDPNAVGPAFNIPKPQPLPTDVAQGQFPVASMTGQTPSATGGPMDYGQVVSQALKQRFAPGVDQSVISRDFLGLPQEPQPKVDVPPEFSNDVMQLKQIASEAGENSGDVFVSGLQKLGMKYIDNPTVLARIKLILQALDE